MNSHGQVRESLAMAYWPRVVGPQASAATVVESVRGGVLFVRTKSSVWSHELTLHKPRLLEGLNRLLGGRIITDIVYRAQGVTEPEPKPAEQDNPSAEELAGVVLDPAEKAELRTRLEELFSLEDDRIRSKIGTCLARDAKLRHWRLEHGWRACVRCGVAQKTDYMLCPICRLSP